MYSMKNIYVPCNSFCIVLLFLTAFAACKKSPAVAATSINNVPADTMAQSSNPVETNPQIYLALGDSYTIGESVDSFERFPAQTAALLTNNEIHISGIQYIATTGWTTVNLLSAIDSQNPKGPFTAVSLLIGVNDQYQAHDTIGYRQNFSRVLNRALQLAGNNASHVFVLSIPDYGVTPFGGNNEETSHQIDMFNAINKEITLSYGISYIDVTTISRIDANDMTMIAGDGLHPSGKQYAQWAQALAIKMLEVMK